VSYTWTDPTAHVYAVGEVVTASTLNLYVQQDLALLGQTRSATVVTQEATTSTSMTDLSTVGPAVTLNAMTSIVVDISATHIQNTVNAFALMSFAISGASTVAASDTWATAYQAYANNTQAGIGARFIMTGLTPGSITVTAKYRATGGTAQFSKRNICVTPLTS
jgi:hypothetical protein